MNQNKIFMKYLCIKDLIMEYSGKIEATKGKIYDFDEMTCFINNSGNSHIMYEELFEFFTDYIWVMVSNYLEKSPISKGIENENNN